MSELSGADIRQVFDRSKQRLSATQPQSHFARVIRRSIQIALVMLLCVSTSPAAPHKIRVRDAAEEQALIARGGKVIADYGSFRLIETEEDFPGGKKREQREDDSDVIELNARRLNTRDADVKAMRKNRTPFAGKQLHLIQFGGPIKPEWWASIESYGVKVVSYIPQNAYLVRGDSAALARLQVWAGITNIVQWEGDYADDYKIHPAARTTDANGQPQTPDTDTFAIQLTEDAVANPQTIALIDQLKLAPIKRQFALLEFVNVIVRLPVNQLTNLAARPDVISIQPYVDPQQRDERQDQIIAGNLSGSVPSGAGYLAWLTGKGFAQSQFDASSFAVDISDSGVDNGTTSPGHFGLYKNGNPFSGSRVIYNRVEGTPNSGSTAAGCDGHGTLNAHIIMGYNNTAAGFPHTDSMGYHYGLGVCPFVKLGSSVIFDSDLFTSPNYANLQSKAYNNGARISANSWGATNNTYTVDSQTYDALVRDAQPTGSTFATAGNQQMVIVFAAGNKGSAANTVGSPGSGKNVITVGASENVQSFTPANGGNSANGSDGCGFNDTGADNVNDIASFSSRGPCSDGRQKPDLVAPGTHVSGGVGQTSTNTSGNGSAIACFKATGVCALPGGGTVGSANNFFPLGQQFYTVSSGTSHSTPAVAGACALLRQYFINTNLAPPSPAMTKAYLMNSTRYLTGVSANDNLWSPNQGMGELNIGTAFDGTPRVLRDQLSADKFTATGQTRVFTVSVTDTNKPFRATLAWTDAPGSTTGNAFNNDLDLTVTVNGTTYKGNIFSGSLSTTGGSADAKNNVENIILPAGTAGTVVVTVSAANINSDGVPNEAPSLDQDFALVIYNVSGVAVSGYTVSSEGCFPTNNAVDAGETVTVNFQIVNSGTADVTNLTATLLATNGVLLPSGSQNYGTLTAGGAAVSRPFTFTTSGSCGGSIMATLQLQSGAANLGTITQVIPLGNFVIQTFNFTNATSFTIPSVGAASLYPSTVVVSGITGNVTKVTATLRGLSHTFPDDIDAVLVRNGGTNVMLMSDVGGSPDISNVTLTFDDAAAASLPDSTIITSGSWKPTNVDTSTDAMQSPAPTNGFGTTMSVFNNTNPNATWSLYIRDDGSMDAGSLSQGWVLSITTSNVYCCNSALNSADLGVSQTASVPVLNAGSNVTFSVVVTNHGADPTAFVSLTNVLPPQLSFVSAVTSQGTCTNTGGIVTCALGLLNANSSATVTIQAVGVNGGSATNIVSVGGGTSDPVAANNTSQLAVFVNTPPVISDIPDQVIAEDTGTGNIPFTIGDAETNASALILTLSCSNTNLIPLSNITLGGSGSNRTVHVLPMTNVFGSVIVTVTVTDGLLNASDLFVVSVTPVNDPPELAPISNRVIVEGATLTFTNSATNVESPPELIVFSLAGAPAGAAINPTNGVFTWTPTEAQGPGTNVVSVVVTDTGSPPLSAMQSFTVVVLETNAAPVLSPVSTQTLVEGAMLVVTNVATDSDLPANTLMFSLLSGPTNAVLNVTNGVLTWPTGESDGGSTNIFEIVVTDNGSPSLGATQMFTVIVWETNTAPVLAAVSNYSIVEGTTLTLTNVATDSDVPVQGLTFSLAGAPTNGVINPTNGVFSWTPTEAQGPGANVFEVIVTDDGTPSLSATQSFTVVILESNQPPVLAAISNFTIVEGETLTFTNTANDADIPSNHLTFSLLTAPTNALVDPTNGMFSWTPLPSQAPSTNVLGVVVTDDGVPPLSATQTFTVVVLATNHLPLLAAISNRVVVEGALLEFTNNASDLDVPAQSLTFSLANTPTNAVINPTNGVFSWTPLEAQGPGTNVIEVIVTDDGTPSLSATQSFTVVVLESNQPPVLAAISNFTIVEGGTVTFTNAVSDADIPANALTFSLLNAPTNAVINPTNGVFSWTPLPSQAPSTNVLGVIVTDDGVPLLSVTQSFIVVVLATNHPPLLAAISNYVVVEGGLLEFTNSASDLDVPVQSLMFSLVGAPTNAVINPTNGVFSWTPAEVQGPGTNVIKVIVTDDGTPSLSVTQSFTVVVLESNQPPVLGAISNFTIVEGGTLTFTNAASDSDIPANVLILSLLTAPTNAVVDPTNGLFSWTPLPSQSPSTNLVVVMVTDDGVPSLSATQSFTVVVLQSNHPPVLAAIADRMVHAGTLIQFTNAATDANLPPDALAFSLETGAPMGAVVGPVDGVFAWTTSDADANTTNNITVRVTDNGLPPLSDAKSFMVTVVQRPLITLLEVTNQTVSVTWTALTGQAYRLEYSTNLMQTNWNVVAPDVISTGASVMHTNLFDAESQQYYRVRVLP